MKKRKYFPCLYRCITGNGLMAIRQSSNSAKWIVYLSYRFFFYTQVETSYIMLYIRVELVCGIKVCWFYQYIIVICVNVGRIFLFVHWQLYFVKRKNLYKYYTAEETFSWTIHIFYNSSYKLYVPWICNSVGCIVYHKRFYFHKTKLHWIANFYTTGWWLIDILSLLFQFIFCVGP